ncbi:FGF23 factor, partial [Amia calva]|nr:FGF23 factor [Amia calva]
PIMHPSSSVLCLLVFLGVRIAQSFPNPSPLLSSNWGNPKRYVHLQTSSESRTFYLEVGSDGQVSKTPSRSAYSVLLLKTETRDRLAIMGVKSKRYLCMDEEGHTFTSTVCHKEDCLFHHKLLENHRDVYYSCKNDLVLNLDGVKHTYVTGKNLPAYSLFLSEPNTVPLEQLLHREKRYGHVNPSDPLGIFLSHNWQYDETSDSRAANTDLYAALSAQAHAVSRESHGTTYNEKVDPVDPLNLLEPQDSMSPRFAQQQGQS